MGKSTGVPTELLYTHALESYSSQHKNRAIQNEMEMSQVPAFVIK